MVKAHGGSEVRTSSGRPTAPGQRGEADRTGRPLLGPVGEVFTAKKRPADGPAPGAGVSVGRKVQKADDKDKAKGGRKKKERQWLCCRTLPRPCHPLVARTRERGVYAGGLSVFSPLGLQ